LSKSTIVDLLRHGEPVGGRRYRGQIDDPLSERGWQEMWYAVSADTPWETIISSPLRRCREFAEKLSEKLALPLDIDERLKEVGFGAWEGQTGDMLRQQDDQILKRFYYDPIRHRPEGAEPLASFSQRVEQALQAAVENHRGRQILIVAHAGVIRCALSLALGLPLGNMYRLSIANASLSRIEFGEQRPPTVVFACKTQIQLLK
jgi:alpha-ribazole phosphatase/probable phosphoglycerate mutase